MTKKIVLDKSLEAAEAARETKRHEGFIAGLFEGETRFDLFSRYLEDAPSMSHDGQVFRELLRSLLIEKVDPETVDREGELPEDIFASLQEIGAFGIKIPKEYGGLGLSQFDYHQVAQLFGGWDAGITILLSAHNSIGVPEPVKQFGNTFQKNYYLRRIAQGAITGFALTEKGAGCDISQIETYAIRVKKDDETVAYRLFGEKLFITNAIKNDDQFLARYLIVIARIVDDPSEIDDPRAKKCFGAFIVDTHAPGCRVVKRLQFEGCRGIYNGIPAFENVYVERENLLGQEGEGLKIALTTLTVGRLTLPAACLGFLKKCLWYARIWAAQRVQWGKPIGEHGDISEKIVRMASRVLALEAMVNMTGFWADQKCDLRLESAALKILATEWLWESVVDLFRIRGGRGFETFESLKSHGEIPVPVGRMMRDAYINLIWEGANGILKMWCARECLAEYVKHGMAFKNGGVMDKFQTALFYATMIVKPIISIHASSLPHASEDLDMIRRKSRELTRLAVSVTIKHQEKLQNKQLLLKELIDSSFNLFAMTSVLFYASTPRILEKPLSPELAGYFYRQTLKEMQPISSLAGRVKKSDDNRVYTIVKRILMGEADWLEEGIIKEG